MAEPFVGEIRMFAGNFAPRGWALCDGQLMAVAQNDALFSLLGTVYGGDGRTTFGLPDLRGRVPVHAGNGPGLTPRRIGDRAGAEEITLITVQMPAHTHGLAAVEAPAQGSDPSQGLPAETESDAYGAAPQAGPAPGGAPLMAAGGARPHTNLMPYLAVNFIIALFGIFPPRH
ncbi:MAG: phage tail protein [Myxococcales bacterium]|nr:phage tail protein [Myxococcales bacterium]